MYEWIRLIEFNAIAASSRMFNGDKKTQRDGADLQFFKLLFTVHNKLQETPFMLAQLVARSQRDGFADTANAKTSKQVWHVNTVQACSSRNVCPKGGKQIKHSRYFFRLAAFKF